MPHHITIGFDKSQEIIVKILANSGLETHDIFIQQENYDIAICCQESGLTIEDDKFIKYPLLIHDFVQFIHVAYYKKYIHNLSIDNNIFRFDGISSKIFTQQGWVSLTLKEVFFLMPLFKGNTIEKNNNINQDVIKKLREKLATINLSLELDTATYTIQPRSK